MSMAFSWTESLSSPCFPFRYRIKLTNNHALAIAFRRMLTSFLLCDLAPTSSVAIQTHNLRRLLHTVEALSELGPALTAERDFSPRLRASCSRPSWKRRARAKVRSCCSMTSPPC